MSRLLLRGIPDYLVFTTRNKTGQNRPPNTNKFWVSRVTSVFFLDIQAAVCDRNSDKTLAKTATHESVQPLKISSMPYLTPEGASTLDI